MRDFRDAKVMAHALRDALNAKSIKTTHGESLELIAKAFGCDDWNVLSARIEEARPRPSGSQSPPARASAGESQTVFCTFCGKSQHDVRTLIAGPSSTYICDECVVVCNDVIDGAGDRALFDLLDADARQDDGAAPAAIAHLRGLSTEELASFVERNRRNVQLYRSALETIRLALAAKDGGATPDDDALASSKFGRLRHQSAEELRLNRERTERGVKRHEQALRMALEVLDARR
jgi:hypothetical protein